MSKELKLLRQVRTIDPIANSDRQQDILLVDGKVAAKASHIGDCPQGTEISDGRDLVLGTGLVDLYSHSPEPGNEARETMQNLAAAAAAGGFTQVAILPDTIPAIDNLEVLSSLRQKSQNLRHEATSQPQIHFWAAAYLAATSNMSELADLQDAVGFSGCYSLSTLHLLKQMLEYVKPWQKPIAIFLSDELLTNRGVVREGVASIRQGLPGNPSYSETAAIAAALEIVAAIGTPVHIMRISTQRSVELIAAAKQRGVPVTASTTWMHLLLDSEAIYSYDPNLRLEPPLGNRRDRISLAEGVRTGIIDAIAVDRRAYTYEEKTVAFAESPPGAVGTELVLPLLWQKFVSSGEWTALELWQALSSRPLACLRQTTLPTASEEAELLLFAPHQSWTASSKNLQSPASNTPWWNRAIEGKVIRTWKSNKC